MRRKYLRVTPDSLAGALKNPGIENGFRLRSEGIPADMKIVGCKWDHPNELLVFVVESAEFELLGDDELIPYLGVMIHKEQHATRGIMPEKC